jgi:branched-subunit amino acid transport protein
VQSALRYAPACALAAILVPDLVFVDQQLWLAPSNPKLLAGLASCLIFAFFRSMIGSLVGGMAVYWVVGYLFAG